MLRLVPLYSLALLAACGDKTFPSLCKDQVPPLVEHRPGQFAACHFAGEPIPPNTSAND